MVKNNCLHVKKIPQFSIQILVDNKAKGKGIISEHGLSFLLNVDGRLVLFDTGQGLALANNAKVLGIDLRQIGKIILSHGHYDHTGGLVFWHGLLSKAVVYAHPDVFLERYTNDEAKGIWECGIPFPRKTLETFGLDFQLSKASQVIEPGIILSGEVPRIYPTSYPKFICDCNGAWTEDTLKDDQFLLANTGFGWILVLGCNHAGLANTLEYAGELTGGGKIRAVIGGMHITDSKPDDLKEKAALLQKYGVEYVIPLHCSGFPAMSYFQGVYGEKFIEGKTGMKLLFEENGVRIVE